MDAHYLWFHIPTRQWRLSEDIRHMEAKLCWIHSSFNPSQYDLSSNPLEASSSEDAVTDTPGHSAPTAGCHNGHHAPVCDTASLTWKVCTDAKNGRFELDERVAVTPSASR